MEIPMIRGNPMHDTTTPPGQVRYLRDVIRKYQEEDRQEALKTLPATQGPTNAEERLEGLLGTLESLARQAELRQGHSDGWWAQELRLLVKETKNNA